MTRNIFLHENNSRPNATLPSSYLFIKFYKPHSLLQMTTLSHITNSPISPVIMPYNAPNYPVTLSQTSPVYSVTMS